MSTLNIAEISPSASTLGPGNRFIIWVQGCPFNCKDCVSPNWIPLKQASLISIQKVANWIIDSSDLEGVTISGGEPFLQSSSLNTLIDLVKEKRPELSWIVFTGFKLKQLIWPEAEDFLKRIDVLISGLYIDKLNDGRGLRGSSNQEVHYLSEKYKDEKWYFEERKRDLEFQVDDSGVRMVGIPDAGFKW
jgi:anaerobic ribonucleoside-triphosphate reductase activating protein